MIHVLRAGMHVPFASLLYRTSQQEQVAAAHKWEPARKILLARKKLEGCNPMDILAYDLEQNSWVKKEDCLGVLKELVMGESAGTVRATIKDRAARSNLTVTDQIDCLVDLATDPNILMKHWQGLSLWV